MLFGKPASIHRHKGAAAEELFGGDWAKNLLFERNGGIFVWQLLLRGGSRITTDNVGFLYGVVF
jgi:hypothetical protein